MSNILDYLDWRGDLSFDADPLNNVDALILAQLSYIVFDGIVSERYDEQISIKDAYALYKPEKVDERLVFFSFNEDMKLLKKLADTERFGKIKLCGYVNRVDSKEALQFSAITCVLPNGSKYISYRGTDGTIAGWKEDFNFSFMTGTPAQVCATEYLDRFSPSDRLFLGGHSKGSNLAIYASVFCKEKIADRIERVFAFDGPGFREDVTETERYKKMIGRITAIVPRSSIIGQLLNSHVENKIVLSSEHGILQHFAYSWQVLGKHFECADTLSKSSTFINKVLDQWFSELDDDTRQIVFDSIFDVIEASDKETLKDIREHKLSSYTAILSAISKLPPERWKTTKDALSLLGETGFEKILEELEKAARNTKLPSPPKLPVPPKLPAPSVIHHKTGQ